MPKHLPKILEPALLRLRHGLLLSGQFVRAAHVMRSWWLLLTIPLILVSLLVVGATKAVAPYAVYTLF